MKTHADTYKGVGPAKMVHKSRLNRLLNMLASLDLTGLSSWADFGCSDGFILEHIKSQLGLDGWGLYGLDHSNELLRLARNKNIPDAVFLHFDLNQIDRTYERHFDVASCFETLEHTGNYRNAFENLYCSAKSGGLIILSVPNETGIAGCLKFMGRKLLRRNAYASFFSKSESTEMAYITALLAGKDIECFRDAQAKHWGPHLGFNYRNLESHVLARYVQQGKLELEKNESSFFGCNKIYVYKKT